LTSVVMLPSLWLLPTLASVGPGVHLQPYQLHPESQDPQVQSQVISAVESSGLSPSREEAAWTPSEFVCVSSQKCTSSNILYLTLHNLFDFLN
jgi:hypothetical protein